MRSSASARQSRSTPSSLDSPYSWRKESTPPVSRGLDEPTREQLDPALLALAHARLPDQRLDQEALVGEQRSTDRRAVRMSTWDQIGSSINPFLSKTA
jgi:hypothetical protein